MSQDKKERKDLKKQMRNDCLNEMETLLELGPNFDTGSIRLRETVWCLTESDPFKSYLGKFNLAEDSVQILRHEQ